MNSLTISFIGFARSPLGWAFGSQNNLMKILTGFQIFLNILCSYTICFAEESQINTELTRKIDVTGDGKSDSISLHIQGQNINSPFTWTLSIISEGKQVFKTQKNDEWWDKNFNDVGFILDCKNYKSCKEKYYFQSILEHIIVPKKMYEIENIVNKKHSGNLYDTGSKYLKKCCNISGVKSEKILTEIESILRDDRAIVISIPHSPVQSDSPMVFAAEINGFVPIYDE
jgi:hypothetical protein